ncbi:hypothetical protein D3C80_1618370 [compost metagenome]
MVSLPPLERRTTRCADSMPVMSRVSLPPPSLMVMVEKLRLVGLKSPRVVTVSLPRPVLMMISSILSSSAITAPFRVTTISVSGRRPRMPSACAATRE